jgi:hypothetical protein
MLKITVILWSNLDQIKQEKWPLKYKNDITLVFFIWFLISNPGPCARKTSVLTETTSWVLNLFFERNKINVQQFCTLELL